MCAGFLGALARLTATHDPLPVLMKPDYWFRGIGEASLGLGGWMLAHIIGMEGLAALACAWASGLLGYAVIHDALLRMLARQTGDQK